MFRSRYLESHHETAIRNICGKGVWHAIGDLDNTRMMKYQTSSIVPRTLKSPTLSTMFENIKLNIFDNVLPNTKYTWHKHNVIKNQGISVIDQAGHYDYEP